MLAGIIEQFLLLLQGTDKPATGEFHHLRLHHVQHFCFLDTVNILCHRQIQVVLNILQLLLGHTVQSLPQGELFRQLVPAQAFHALRLLRLHQLIVFRLRKGKFSFCFHLCKFTPVAIEYYLPAYLLARYSAKEADETIY